MKVPAYAQHIPGTLVAGLAVAPAPLAERGTQRRGTVAFCKDQHPGTSPAKGPTYFALAFLLFRRTSG